MTAVEVLNGTKNPYCFLETISGVSGNLSDDVTGTRDKVSTDRRDSDLTLVLDWKSTETKRPTSTLIR